MVRRIGLTKTVAAMVTILGMSAATSPGFMVAHAEDVKLTRDAVDESAGGVPCYRIETSAATYYLEKTGAGLSSMVDREGVDWLSFHKRPGSKAGGEYRGFPNAVHQQAGNYFHPRNEATDPSATSVEYAGDERVSIRAEAGNGLWACQYDFFPTHCTFTMTRMPEDKKYWVLYEGTPGGKYNATDWWVTSQRKRPTPLTKPHDGDIPALEWIAFGDTEGDRVLVLVHHEDDQYSDRFYQMNEQMTVFGFGRLGITKFLDSVPQRFSIFFLETTSHEVIDRRVRELLR